MTPAQKLIEQKLNGQKVTEDEDYFVSLDVSIGIGFADESDAKSFYQELKNLVERRTERGFDYDISAKAMYYNIDGPSRLLKTVKF